MKIRMEDYPVYDDFLAALQVDWAKPIDHSRLDEEAYFILVLWLHGAFTTRQISDVLRIRLGRVNSVIRSRQQGGHMPKERDFLEIEDRQRLLDHLTEFRMDGGKLADRYFVAQRSRA